MLLLKDRGKAFQVLAPIKIAIDKYPAAIWSGELIEIRNEIWSRTNTGCDAPHDQNRGYTSVGQRLRSAAVNLPEPNQRAPTQQRQERINNENMPQAQIHRTQHRH